MKNFIFKKRDNKGFTLIELLVVIAIIGVLAAVVLASLNSAREKGRIAAIKSNLKNIIPQAELYYGDNNGSYQNFCTNAVYTKFADAITNLSGIAKCYSHPTANYPSWAVSAKLNSDDTKNYSATSLGVVTWATVDASASKINWNTANSTCASQGGRLPSIEELKSYYNIYATNPAPGFIADVYWTNTTYPTDSTGAYILLMQTGAVSMSSKNSLFYARCVQ